MKRIGLVVGVLIAMTACSKYEDGPAVSLSSKKSRIANDWEFVEVMNDGNDVTDNYDNFLLELDKDGDAKLTASYSFGDFYFEYETDGTWEFNDSKETLELDFERDDADNEYQILRLTQNELWLREKGEDTEFKLEGK